MVLFWQHLPNSIQDVVGGVTLNQPGGGKDPPKNNPITIKTQLHPQSQPKNGMKGIPRAPSSGDQGDCITESHRFPTIEVHTTKSGSQNRSI